MQKIVLKAKDGYDIEVAIDRVACNNVIFPWEFNPHNVRLWVICNEYGPMGAVWADNEGDAIDELVDNDLAGGILLDDEYLTTLTDDEREDVAHIGNAGEAADLTNCRMFSVDLEATFKLEQGLITLAKFAEARGNSAQTLDF